MSAGKHTPGPWQKKRNISSVSVLDNSGGLIARLPVTEFDFEKQDANARLIAAAPELLQAAQVARARIALERDVFVDCNAYPDGSLLQADQSMLDDFNDLLARIDAAIAKATGGAT